jgi:hypothetical protein
MSPIAHPTVSAVEVATNVSRPAATTVDPDDTADGSGRNSSAPLSRLRNPEGH